ncbi:MAG: hypothetical protein ABI625_10290 [bacterium]
MRALLIIRGLVGLWFGARLLTNPAVNWSAVFALLSLYLIVDGVVGFGAALTLFGSSVREKKRHLGSLAAVLLIDAVGRTVSGLAVRMWPGIPYFPVTAVMFIALMAVFTTMVGFVEAGLIVEEDFARYGTRHAPPQFIIPPVLASAITSVLFGTAALFFAGNPAMLRVIIGVYVAIAGIAMLSMAFTRRHGVVSFGVDHRPT